MLSHHRLAARGAAVWLGATVVAGGAVRGLVADLLAGADTSTVDGAVTALCESVLVVCVAWAWLATTAVVVEAVLGARTGPADRATRVPGVPQAWRRLVLLACGVAITVGVALPAGATPGSVQFDPGGRDGRGTSVLDGLPMPQRATDRRGAPAPAQVASTRAAPAPAAPAPATPAAPPPVTAGAAEVVVRLGDSLWSIAAAGPAELSPTDVSARWQEIYRLNRAVVGDDPDLIVPGQRLTLPPSPR